MELNIQAKPGDKEFSLDAGITSKLEENFEDIFNFESGKAQEERIRAESKYGTLLTWRLLRVIVKSGDDLRSEQFAMQLIETMDLIFRRRKLKLKLTPYDILSTGENCGIVEFIPDAFSIDYLKKKMQSVTGREVDLLHFYRMKFKDTSSGSETTFKQAVCNLADSLAAYSLVCYILQIKDRHNGNILINMRDGSLVHIDFGFILNSRLLNFETAPFKLTNDIIKLLGGLEGEGFKRFRNNMIDGYQALHNDNEKIVILVQMIGQSQKDLPCFKRGVSEALHELKQRLTPLGPKVKLNRAQCTYEIDKIIREAYKNWSTSIYDKYQYCFQGIF